MIENAPAYMESSRKHHLVVQVEKRVLAVISFGEPPLSVFSFCQDFANPSDFRIFKNMIYWNICFSKGKLFSGADI